MTEGTVQVIFSASVHIRPADARHAFCTSVVCDECSIGCHKQTTPSLPLQRSWNQSVALRFHPRGAMLWSLCHQSDAGAHHHMYFRRFIARDLEMSKSFDDDERPLRLVSPSFSLRCSRRTTFCATDESKHRSSLVRRILIGLDISDTDLDVDEGW